GSLMAGLGIIFHPIQCLQLLCIIAVTAVAFNGMMFLMMVRVDDPLVPRAMFGVLNTLLFFPSGAIYPISAFPKWLRGIAIVDPFSYSIHALQQVLLKDGGWVAIYGDLLFLGIFGIGTLLIASSLFKRTL
ncbi:MAG TPA: ABC transporter permease, partial [Terracidiphilus sp.]|nr:ABC transporter permease [Terracidiphilus sp.]